MAYKAGVLGVAVLMVAIVGTLMGSWIMSMDVEEEQVIKYDPLADIVGLFDSEQTPTFTEYNPSTNYTGYYTDTSVIGDTKYFDGVDYNPSEKPNAFKVQEEPNDLYSGTVDLSAIEGESIGIIDLYRGKDLAFYRGTPEMMKLTDLLSTLGYSNYNLVYFTNVNDNIDWTQRETDWVGFCSQKMIGQPEYGTDIIAVKTPGVPLEVSGAYASWNWMDPIVAAKYDTASNSVQLFYDNAMTKTAGVISIDDAYIMWGNRSGTYELGDSIKLEGYDLPSPSYMDPSAGVVMA